MHQAYPKHTLLTMAMEIIQCQVRPDIYVICHLKKAAEAQDESCSIEWYQKASGEFISLLEDELYKLNPDTFEPLKVAYMLGLENGTAATLNFLIRQPTWITYNDFVRIFISCWTNLDWSDPQVKIGYQDEEAFHTCIKDSLDTYLMIAR